MDAVLNTRFVEVLKDKIAKYFRATRVQPAPAVKGSGNPNYDEFWAFHEYRTNIMAWASFVDQLFSAQNCTPQFWEKYGSMIADKWPGVKAACNAVPEVSTPNSYYLIHELLQYVGGVEDGKFDALVETIEAWKEQSRGEWVRKAQKTVPRAKGARISESQTITFNGYTHVFQNLDEYQDFTYIFEGWWTKERQRLAEESPEKAAAVDSCLPYFVPISAYQREYQKLGDWPGDIFPTYWESENHLLDECLRVLVRITREQDGALVPLWDLLDEQQYDRYLVIREIYAWAALEVPPPIPYEPGAAVFTKVSETFDAVRALLREFDEWHAPDNSGKKE
jgi:hypothetical protein